MLTHWPLFPTLPVLTVASLSEVPPTIVTLNLLCHLLHEHVTVAKDNLVVASMTAPMYGILQGIRAVFELLSDDSLAGWNGSDLGQILATLVETCKFLSELVSPVVCSSSPEGFLPETSAKASSEMAEMSGSFPGSAQSLLLCCWHTMKEVSLLLGLLVEHFYTRRSGESGVPLLTHDQVSPSPPFSLPLP